MIDARRIVVTAGEPAGIGAEMLIKAAAGIGELITIDDPKRLEALARQAPEPITIRTITMPNDSSPIPKGQLGVLPIEWDAEVSFGKPSPKNAPKVIAAIDTAVAMVKAGKAAAVVTNPIQKSTLHEAGFPYAGHTEYLAKLDGAGTGAAAWAQTKGDVVMMLANADLRVVPLTIHVPLREVAPLITGDRIATTARIIHRALKEHWGIPAPRIAVTGLNPHAGEAGLLGDEEATIIAPAIAELQSEGLDIKGPFPADSLFFSEHRENYDAILAMYHDQALIPIKTLDFHHSVNITLGLSFIRTSPDHGTALDQAGQFTARPDSLIAAIEMARNLK